MSKAFTKEDTDSDDEDIVVPEPPAGARNYITPGGYARLRDEQAHLVKVERPEVVRVVSWAASNGDRSENVDCIYGKKRLREIDRRIRFLTRGLDIAEVVDKWRVIEFVPKSDSQVQKLLASREDIFPSYTRQGFEAAFTQKFKIHQAIDVKESERVLYLMEAL